MIVTIASLAACASNTPTTVILPANQVPLSTEQRASAMEWFASRGITYAIAYDADGNVVFQYGGRQHVLDETAFIEFAKRRMLGQTVIGVSRPNLTSSSGSVLEQITYFAPEGMAYSWGPAQFGVVPSKISFRPPSRDEKVRGFVGGVMCYAPIISPYVVCSAIYDQLIGTAGRHDGDPFRLANLEAPRGLTESSNWPDGQPLVPARSPHD
ncbi:hypothetical protein [uncultured Brevundimonas sp.]|uniref:hypothetical protein n=1 Tax=uncultured Brevundimonas sp. TaxID=213418 RepID=UPI002622E17F|nr:hypothetical protein [uncultured Brevundimonas sp.]